MLDTDSVFNHLAADDQDRRVASHQALALAQTRLENSLGAFLRGAVTTGEFQERFAACEADFNGHVAEAGAEFGVEDTTHIAEVLKGHFHDTRRWSARPLEAGDKHWIQDAVKRPGQLHKDLGVPEGEKIPEGKLEEAEHSDNPKERERAQFAENVKGLGKKKKGQDQKKVDPSKQKDVSKEQDGISALDALDAQEEDNEKTSGVGPGVFGPQNPQDQQGLAAGGYDWGQQNDQDPYTCPQCGQDSRFCPHGQGANHQQGLVAASTHTAAQCRDCGKEMNGVDAMVGGADKGDPICQACVQKKQKAVTGAESGNTDLGGPEPKIDTRLWEPSNMGDPEIEDGRWPTERVDLTETLTPNNESEIKGAGEKFTEHQTLPSDKSNAGFSSGGPGPAPHTDTWTSEPGAADPVTKTDLS